MGKPTTGVTKAQIEAAVERTTHPWFNDRDVAANRDMLRLYAGDLVPPDHRVIGPDVLAALQRVLEGVESDTLYIATPDDLDRLHAVLNDPIRMTPEIRSAIRQTVSFQTKRKILYGEDVTPEGE